MHPQLPVHESSQMTSNGIGRPGGDGHRRRDAAVNPHDRDGFVRWQPRKVVLLDVARRTRRTSGRMQRIAVPGPGRPLARALRGTSSAAPARVRHSLSCRLPKVAAMADLICRFSQEAHRQPSPGSQVPLPGRRRPRSGTFPARARRVRHRLPIHHLTIMAICVGILRRH